MAVNQSVYGAKSKWGDYVSASATVNVPRDEKILTALFLDDPFPANDSAPQAGYSIGNAIWRMENDSTYSTADSLDEVLLDRSTTFFGMGGEKCPYHKIKWISNRSESSGQVPIQDEGSDEFDVVNTFFTSPSSTLGNNIPGPLFFEADSGGSNLRPTLAESSWNPNRYPGEHQTQTYTKYYYSTNNSRNAVQIITQMPVKRIVWVPIIYCKESGTGTSISQYDLATYLSTYKQTKPWILSIGLKAYYDVRADITTGTIDRSQSPNFGLGLNMRLSAFDGYYGGYPDSTTRYPIDSDNPFVLWQMAGRGLPIGGYITGVDSNPNPPLQTALSASFRAQGIIDCGALEWAWWSGDGEPTSAHYLYCDASQYTDEEITTAIREATACFGMFFTDSSHDAQYGALDAEGMFLGIFDEDGVGRGNYSEGQDNRNQPQWNWKTMDQNAYDPSSIIPSPDWDGGFVFGSEYTSNVNGLLCRWVIDDGDVMHIWDTLNNVYSAIENDIDAPGNTLKRFFTNNPIDNIVSLQYIPVTELSSMQNDEDIYLGTVNCGITGRQAKINRKVNCGNIRIDPIYTEDKTWLDGQRKILIYAPYCGIITLDPEVVVGKTINLEYCIDLITGACTAYVSTTVHGNKRAIVDSIDGYCAIDLPVSGIETETLKGQLFNAYSQNKQLKVNNAVEGAQSVIKNGISVVVGAATGALPLALNGASNLVKDFNNISETEKRSDYNLTHTMLPTRTVGSASSAIGLLSDVKPKLIVYNPQIADSSTISDFGHTEGFACCEFGKISDYGITGKRAYVQTSNADLSGISAPDDIKRMILSALQSGVYV